MNPRSIAIFAPQFKPTGVAPAMLSLASDISSDDHKVELISAIREWRSVESDPDRANLSVYTFKIGALLRILPAEGWLRFRLSNIFAALILVFSLLVYVLRHKPDVLIVAMQPIVAVLAALLSASGVKLIISVQGAPRPGRFRIWLWRLFWRRSHAIVCESQSIATRLENFLDVPPESIRVIYNPHYEARIHGLANAETQYLSEFNQSEFTAVALGRLTPQKGFDVALRAIRIASEQIDVRLLVLGTGNELERLEELRAKLGLCDRVSFLGQIENPYPIIANSDIFISSSRWEGLARAPIEAQALRVPVVVTDIDGGVRETVLEGKAGVLVAVDDPEKLSGSIVDLLRDKTRSSELIEAASRGINRFSSERAAGAFLSVVDEILVDRHCG